MILVNIYLVAGLLTSIFFCILGLFLKKEDRDSGIVEDIVFCLVCGIVWPYTFLLTYRAVKGIER